AATGQLPFGAHELLAAVAGAGRVLDLGCGSGRLTLALARAGAAVTGLDTSRERLEQARRRAGEGGVELEEAGDDAATEAAPAIAPEGTLLRSVQGPPADVVRVLEEAGIPAEVVGGQVVATGAEGDVRAALRGRPNGGVDVYVR
ncbi:MAG TPA: class I SAM-dependent methyltransferase, partial [Gaiellaceae bacterium]|nr:class I SAM-dependent methyltransferase [Gaiellaceae bacterium]